MKLKLLNPKLMSRLTFIIVFAIRFITMILKNNIFKILSLIAIVISSSFIINMKPVDDSDRFIVKFEDKGKFIYVVESGERYDVRIFDKKPIEKQGNSIEYQRTSDWIILHILIIIFASAFVIIGSIPMDDDFGWKIGDAIDETKLGLVKCDFEDNVYYYHYNGRLLIKSNTNNISHNAILSELEYTNLHPKYEGTKSQQRDKKLSNILR